MAVARRGQLARAGGHGAARYLAKCLVGAAPAAALAALGYAAWRLVGHTPYRIDIDVYRMGGQAWLDGRPLYDDGVEFHTPIGLNLPFTYPPLAAIVFCPFAWLGLPVASVTITLITLALLLVSTMIVLTRLDVWSNARVVPGRPGCADGC